MEIEVQIRIGRDQTLRGVALQCLVAYAQQARRLVQRQTLVAQPLQGEVSPLGQILIRDLVGMT